MADPITLALVSASGTLISGFAAKQAGNFQAKVAAMNANIANQNAERAIFTGQVEQQQQDLEAAALLDEQLSAQSGSGLSVGSRSSANTRKSTQILSRKDAETIRRNAEIEAYNFRTDAANFNAKGKLAKMEGKAALISSIFDAGSSLIGSAKSTGKTFRRPAGGFGRAP